MAKEKKEKPEKEKKSKVKKVKEKPEKTKEKKGKKGKEDAEEEEGGGGGKKKLILIVVLLLLILGGGAGSAYFLVYLPMTQAQVTEEVSTTLEAVVQPEEVKPSGYYGYLSYNPNGNNQLFIDGVDLIFANETALVEKMGLSEDNMSSGYYISNPQAATRLIYVDQGTIFTIISKETGEDTEVNWSGFVEHLGSSSILFEFTSYNNILLTVTEFPVNNFKLPAVEDLPPAPEEETESETTPEVVETTPEVPETTPEVPETTPEVPETTPEVPETTPEVPETTPEVPETAPEIAEDDPTQPPENPQPEIESSTAPVDPSAPPGSTVST